MPPTAGASRTPPNVAKSNGFPVSVRYVKNGTGEHGRGQWWKSALENSQVHAGWTNIPCELLLNPNPPKIEELVREDFRKRGKRRGATQDFNALCDLLNGPSKHLWVTIEDGCLWWCTVRDGAIINPKGRSLQEGNFWLVCDRPWSNHTLSGKLLSISDLPGPVEAVGGFRATVCTPKAWQTILRIVQDEKDTDAAMASDARRSYERAVHTIVKRLSPKDFEQLIDLILARTGWTRISTPGPAREGIDVEAENLTTNEKAFVQVKSSAGQKVFDDYIERFKERREFYARMIFAVHSPIGELMPPANLPAVQLWTGDKVAQLVVRLGLGEWVEKKIAGPNREMP